MNQVKIGIFIAKCRQQTKLTQQQLANKLGVTDKAVSKWENGRCMPDISLIEKLANILNISVSEILSGEKLEEITKINSDEIVKDSISFFQREYFKKRITKVIISLVLFFSIGYLLLLIIGEMNYGEAKWTILGTEYSMPLPSFSIMVAKNNSKIFLKAMQNYDYETIEKILLENEVRDVLPDSDWISFEEYIDILKEMKSEGVRLSKYTIRFCYHNGNAYTCDFDLYFDYNQIKYNMTTQISNYKKRVRMGGIGLPNDTNKIKAINNMENQELYKKIEKLFFKY